MVLIIAIVCFYTQNFIGYRLVAMILLMTVSFIAMLFEILPVLLAAVLSAIIWNFFFIPPLYTFHIHNAEDVLMFLLYFIVALVNAVLTFKIREAEKKSRDEEEKENTIRLYNTLLNSLSHELRTPISTILGAVDTLKENKDKLSLSSQTELLSEIDKASIRLNRQVENLLNMSRLESGMLKPKMDWCDINELINGVINKISPTHNHRIEFINNEQIPLFKMDSGLMEQIIYNLLHNAIQYTPENTKITIKAEHINNYCLITVSDTGKGFPESEIPFVFDKFYRLPNTKAGGSGIGLSIVKGFIEAHNGKITLENNSSGGAKFTIEIPAETSFINNLKNE
jgi:two-component system sensor histidine kinase KdpD